MNAFSRTEFRDRRSGDGEDREAGVNPPLGAAPLRRRTGFVEQIYANARAPTGISRSWLLAL